MRRVHAFLLLLTSTALSGCASNPAGVPLVTAAQVDLARYMGRWHVIANIPYFAERGKVGAYVEYRARDDGRMDDLYYARDGSFDREIELTAGVAWVADPASNAHWKVRFFWPFSSEYLILYVSGDYRYALIGHPSRDYAWIFAREPEMAEWIYAGLLARLAAQNYDVSRLRKVPQTKEQIGLPGFE